jgi:hypothetical protein
MPKDWSDVDEAEEVMEWTQGALSIAAEAEGEVLVFEDVTTGVERTATALLVLPSGAGFTIQIIRDY